nr:PREDICTED: uncharacterized protein LOC107397619 [Tribolium castaneum]|eukprot:XP_015833885.1 PREDICTED: uncharacterized protein LOC107397619 [Tribolium castaneum]
MALSHYGVERGGARRCTRWRWRRRWCSGSGSIHGDDAATRSINRSCGCIRFRPSARSVAGMQTLTLVGRSQSRRLPTTSWLARSRDEERIALLPPLFLPVSSRSSGCCCTSPPTAPPPAVLCTCIAPACCTRINITHYHKKLTRLEAGLCTLLAAKPSRDNSARHTHRTQIRNMAMAGHCTRSQTRTNDIHCFVNTRNLKNTDHN